MGATLASLGVGGTPPPITNPTQIAGCVLWLRADAGTWQDAGASTPASADADPMLRWDDQSGNGNHVTSAAAAALKLAIQNSLSVIRFDGAAGTLAVAFTLAQPHTRFAVLAIRSTADGTHVPIDGGSGSPSSQYLVAGPVAAINAGTELDGPAADAAFHIWRTTFNSASSALSLDNGPATGGDAGAGPAGGITLGTDQSLTRFADCDIAEVIEYSSALSDTDVGRVVHYLNTRWAVY